jgi:hypothetical protein
MVLPKVKSWRDTGDTPGKINHQEEAKLQHPHTPSPCITSPLHVKCRNQEGSHTEGHQCLTCLGEVDDQVSYVARSTPTGNPGTNQHSHLDRLTPTQ